MEKYSRHALAITLTAAALNIIFTGLRHGESIQNPNQRPEAAIRTNYEISCNTLRGILCSVTQSFMIPAIKTSLSN